MRVIKFAKILVMVPILMGSGPISGKSDYQLPLLSQIQINTPSISLETPHELRYSKIRTANPLLIHPIYIDDGQPVAFLIPPPTPYQTIPLDKAPDEYSVATVNSNSSDSTIIFIR